MSFLSDLYVTVAMIFIKFIVYSYEYLTLPIYFLFSKTQYFMPFPEDKDNYFKKFKASECRTLSMPTRCGDPSSPWRAVEYIDNLATDALPGCKTLSDIWLRTIKMWPYKPALGTRRILSSSTEELPSGKKFIKLELGSYYWETFSEAEIRVSQLAAGLYSVLGSNKNAQTPIVLYSETRAEWLLAAQSIFRVNRPIATLYSTLGEDAIIHGLMETEASVIFTSDELLSNLIKIVSKCPLVKNVIFFSNGIFKKKFNLKVNDISRFSDTARDSIETARRIVPSTVKIYDVLELENIGKECIDREAVKSQAPKAPSYINWQPPKEERTKPDDLAVIMYTSGSTGQPKGVEITHTNLTCAVAGYFRRLPRFRPDDNHLYIGYLPQAHVLELVCEICALINGVPIGFSSPQTLTDKSSKINQKLCKGDISVLQPTLFVSVPTVLERITKAVWEKVREGGPMREAIFQFAYEYKWRRLYTGFPSFIVDHLIFRKVRNLMGGRILYIVSGGAPLSEETHLFTNVCFAPITQGYGLTETCAAGCLMEGGDLRGHHCGAPTPSVQVKLIPWEEGGYSPHDKPFPQGEILISGGVVARGYYKNEKATSEAFITDAEGIRWFCTGDIGMIHQDGSFSIIDRKKDLVKLQAGEYVSLIKVELALSQSRYVENICVYADSRHTYVICFVSPKLTEIRKLAAELGLLETAETNVQANLPENHSSDEHGILLAVHTVLCTDKKINQSVLEDLKKVGRTKKLASFEIPQKMILDSDTWTPMTGLVTDAMKLKRANIKIKFADALKNIYLN